MLSESGIGFSMAVLVFASVFTVVFLLMWVVKRNRRMATYPPCLSAIPFLGSLPFLPKLDGMHVFFMEKSKSLGKIFSIQMCNQFTVVLNGRDAIYSAFVKQSHIFSDRPNMEAIKLIDPEGKGFIFHQYNADFKQFHQLSLNILRELGFGRGIMEKRIRVECDELISQLELRDGKASDPSDVITMCVFNVIASIIFGKRYEVTDPKLKEMINSVNTLVRISANTAMTINYFPLLQHLPSYKNAFKLFFKLDDQISQNMEQHIQRSLSGEEDKSFISCYEEAVGTNFDYHTLLFTLKDLYIAGTETTSTTLQWMMVFMANHPDVQRRCQKEIDSVVPRSQPPSLDDKVSMPYVEATILEMMRVRTLVPLGVPHRTTEDTTLGGYVIPANSMVIANLYSAHMDPEIWKNPEQFCPERFIDGTGSVINRELVIPFSLGKRACLGEMLARQELLLFTTSLLQHFEILPPEGQLTIDCHSIIAVTNSPPPFQVRLLRRP